LSALSCHYTEGKDRELTRYLPQARQYLFPELGISLFVFLAFMGGMIKLERDRDREDPPRPRPFLPSFEETYYSTLPRPLRVLFYLLYCLARLLELWI